VRRHTDRFTEMRPFFAPTVWFAHEAP
jgi:hypothetical protein